MTGRNGAARPLIVELVGPAGVGKSALAQRLLARHDVMRASVWNLPWVLLLESAVRSLPLLLRLCVVTRALPREELKQIVRLNALRLFIGRRVAGAAVVVLDEGPVFALSWLRVFGHPRDRKSTRLNSSHGYISYAVFCLKKKKYTAAQLTSVLSRAQPPVHAHCLL